MSRSIEIKLHDRTTYAKVPQNPPPWFRDYFRLMVDPNNRIFEVVYDGERVLLGALAFAKQDGPGLKGSFGRSRANDPWAKPFAIADFNRAPEARGTAINFDELLLGSGRSTNPMRIKHVIYAKNRYWVMWIKYLLHRRQNGHRGSYETLLGSFETSIKGKATNLYGRINSLYKKLHRSEDERLARENVRRDAKEELLIAEANEILESLDDDGSLGRHLGAVNF